MGDNDPDATLSVGGDMRKVNFCFRLMKVVRRHFTIFGDVDPIVLVQQMVVQRKPVAASEESPSSRYRADQVCCRQQKIYITVYFGVL